MYILLLVRIRERGKDATWMFLLLSSLKVLDHQNVMSKDEVAVKIAM